METNGGYSEKNIEPTGIDLPQESIYVNCCGVDRLMKSEMVSYRPKGRKDWYLLYMTDGTLTGEVGERNLLLESGQLILLPPETHQRLIYKSGKVKEIYWLHMTGMRIAPLLKELSIPLITPITLGYNRKITEILHAITGELQLKKPFYERETEGLVYGLLTDLARSLQQTPTLPEDMQSLITYMHKSFPSIKGIEDLSAFCHLSPCHLIHKFKDHTGRSPVQYLKEIRIEQAKKLLVNSLMPIGEAGRLCGYDDPLYFSRVFKRETAMSPREFRKNN